MAWTAQDKFNSYSNGDLDGKNGGTGWSGAWTNFGTELINVTGAQTYEGTKSVLANSAASFTFYGRLLTSQVTGNGNVCYVAMRRSGISAGGDQAIIWKTVDGDSRIGLKLNGSGDISIGGATTVVVKVGYAFDTWYVIRVTLNVDAGTATAAWSTDAYGSGGSWSVESAEATMSNSNDIGLFVINCDAEDGTEYIDYISGVDPLPVQTSSTLTSSSSSTRSTSSSSSCSTSSSSVSTSSSSISTSVTIAYYPTIALQKLKLVQKVDIMSTSIDLLLLENGELILQQDNSAIELQNSQAGIKPKIKVQ